MGKDCVMKDVYYKVTVTKGDLSSSVYWWEKSYTKMLKSVDFLYKYAKIDAVELEMISKEDYDNGE